jgi:thiol-disulfide isomerase/thioredoxin
MSVVAYHFWSPTCPPCKRIKPAVEELKEDFSQYTWITVNTHNDVEGYTRKFGVSVVPTLVIVTTGSDGNVIARKPYNTPLPYTDKYSGEEIGEWTKLLRNATK